MQARFWLAPIVLFLSNLPKTTLAQDNPRIYLTPSQVVGEDNRLAEGLDGALLSAVGDRPIVILTPNLGSSGGSLGEVAAKLKEGQKLVDSDPEKAVDILKGAVDIYEASMGQVEDFEPYLLALSLLATAYFNAGFEDEFSAIAKKYAALRLDGAPKGINKDVADEIASAQGKVKKLAPGTIKITASDPAFQVRVDGADMAAAKSLQLPPGLHFIVITAPGQEPITEKVNVTASGTSQVNATFTATNNASTASPIEKATAPSKELLDFLKKGTINAETRTQVSALAKKNKADFVVLNIVARDGGQYGAHFYALRAKDGKLVELASPSYTPGPAATLTAKTTEVMDGLVGVAYNFPEAKALPATPAITISAKGAAPLVANPTNPTNPGVPTKVNPYDVGVAKLSTNGSDTELTAPPDAQGGNGAEPEVRPAGGNKTKFVPEPPVETTPKALPKEPKNTARVGKGALTPNVEEPKPPRDPITFGEISEKWWFWPAVGVVGAGAVGTGVYFIAKPNGLDATITWP